MNNPTNTENNEPLIPTEGVFQEDESVAISPASTDVRGESPVYTPVDEFGYIEKESPVVDVTDTGVKVEETLAFKMAQELGIEMQEILIQDPNATVDRSQLRFEDHPLVGGVTRLFQYLNHPNPEDWLIDLDEAYISDPRQVQVLLTHHFHRHLSRLEMHEGKASVQIRQVLAAEDKLSDWLVMLELVVIPFMIDNDLPMGMTGRDPLAPVSPAAQMKSATEDKETNVEELIPGDALEVEAEPREVQAGLAFDHTNATIADASIPKEGQTVMFFGDQPMQNEELRYLDVDNITPEVQELMVTEALTNPAYFDLLCQAAQVTNPNEKIVEVVQEATKRGASIDNSTKE